MKEIRSKEELRKSLDAGEKHFIVTDKKLLKALAVRFWIQNNKVKGGLLLASLPAAIAVGGVAAPVNRNSRSRTCSGKYFYYCYTDYSSRFYYYCIDCRFAWTAD